MAKQLSLPERYVIEQMLHQDYSFASIGRNLDRSASTIAREVLHYRCFTSRSPIMGENDCINRPSCQSTMTTLTMKKLITFFISPLPLLNLYFVIYKIFPFKVYKND